MVTRFYGRMRLVATFILPVLGLTKICLLTLFTVTCRAEEEGRQVAYHFHTVELYLWGLPSRQGGAEVRGDRKSYEFSDARRSSPLWR